MGKESSKSWPTFLQLCSGCVTKQAQSLKQTSQPDFTAISTKKTIEKQVIFKARKVFRFIKTPKATSSSGKGTCDGQAVKLLTKHYMYSNVETIVQLA
ncbi:hypothetical protein CPB83DRAFT_141673 [Crepidotus variabilis]|uniref:Uncharacterized protein n=1 Tax=Crepidotus variabilis TaxID=179855 RepID=A0A9P6E402_9AGAR|nr:hypothetical protein CPB83DRAFT_141673 [Crepidotus variabilis]